MTRGDIICLSVALILAAWLVLHQRNLSPSTQAFGDELLDLGVEDLAQGFFD